MLIGENFPKIEFSLFGLDLLEPNALIANLLLCFLCIYYWWRLRECPSGSLFVWGWKNFFLIFGIGFFFGGLGHSLWNYLGIYGKIIPWGSSLFAIYFLERAIISIHKIDKARRRLALMVGLKLIFMVLALGLALIFYSQQISANLPMGFLIPSVDITIGLLFSLLILPLYYHKKGWGNFHNFIISVFILLPSTVFQVMKINLHPWMDRNDVAHILMLVAFVYYWKGVQTQIKTS